MSSALLDTCMCVVSVYVHRTDLLQSQKTLPIARLTPVQKQKEYREN